MNRVRKDIPTRSNSMHRAWRHVRETPGNSVWVEQDGIGKDWGVLKVRI